MRARFAMTVATVLLAVCVVLASAGVETTTAIEAASATTSTTATPVALGPRSTAPLASDFCLIAPLRNASCSSGTIRFFYNSQHNACDVMTDACFGSLNVFDTITACQTACVQHYCNSTSDCSMGQSCSKPGCGTKRTCVPGLVTYSACDPNSCTPCKSNDTCYLNYKHVSTCCPAITCPTGCPYGRRLDRYGCQRCDCLGSPCEGMMCASGMRCFNVAQRDTWRAVCVNASTLSSNLSSVACNTDENIDKWLTDNSATYNRYGDPLAAVYSQLPSCRLCYVRMRHPTRPWCNTAVSPIEFGNGTTNVTDDSDSHHHTSDFDLTNDDVDDDDYNQPLSVKNRTACTTDSDCSSLQYCSRSLYCAHFRKYGESCDGDDRCTDGNECLHTMTTTGVCCKPNACTTVCMYGLVSDASGCPKCTCRSNPCLPNPCSNGSRCQAGQSGLYSCLLNSTSTIGPLLLSPVDTKSTSILQMARWLMSYLNPPGTQCQVFLLRVKSAAISMIAGSMYELEIDVASAMSCLRPNKKNIIIPQSQVIDPDSYQAVSATLLNQQGLYSLISLQASANISAIPTPDYSYFDTENAQDTVNPTSNSNSTVSSSGSGRFIRIVLPVVATVGLFSIGLVAIAMVVTRHSRRDGMSIQEFTTTIDEDDEEEYLEWEDDMSSQNELVNSTSANFANSSTV